MTPAAIIQQATADGVTLVLTPSGTIKATGAGDSIKRWQAILREHKPGIVATLREAANEEAARGWRVHSPKLDPMGVLFAPTVTRAEVAVIYVGARIEPLPESSGRNATPEEAAELRNLVALVFGDDTDAHQADALAAALADPERALRSFRVLATEFEGRA